MEYQNIKLVKDGHVAIMSINRPGAMNALSTQTAREILAALEEMELDDDVFAAVFTAEGDKSFCVGADLKERKTMTREEMKKQRVLFVRTFTAVAEFENLARLLGGMGIDTGVDFPLLDRCTRYLKRCLGKSLSP